MKKLNKKLIGVTIGDIEGIGIHLLLKEYLNYKIKDFILITNIKIFTKYVKFPKQNINIVNKKNKFNLDYNAKKLNIYSYETKNKNTNVIDSLELSCKLTNNEIIIGVLTLPLNKNKINKFVNKKFIDQTSFFSDKENVKNNNMVFYYKKKFFIPLTIHIELKKVSIAFKNTKKIIYKINNLIQTLKKDFKIYKPKIILAGINPHAGENNVISSEDDKYLLPIINYFKKKNIYINGPNSADGMINKENLKKYDVFVFTYHDQALIPFKIISNYQGVNFTSNLKIIRTSPSHGTAEHLIGSNNATSKGIINSFKLIKKIHRNRNIKIV